VGLDTLFTLPNLINENPGFFLLEVALCFSVSGLAKINFINLMEILSNLK